MKNLHRVIVPIAVLFMAIPTVFPSIQGQEIRSLSLQELFRLADAENADIKASQSNIRVSEQQEKIAHSSLLPQLDVSLSAGYLGNGLILDRDFSHPVTDKLPHLSNALSVELYYPLYVGGSIAGGIKLSKKQTEMAGVGLESTRNSIRMMLVGNCLELAKNQNLLGVYQENIHLTEQLLAQMRTRLSQGVVLKNDITRYELKLSSLHYDSLATGNAIGICRANLNSLLDLGDTVAIEPQLESFEPEYSGNEADWLQLARSKSPQLKTFGLQNEMERIGKNITRAEYIPKIGVVASENLSGPVTFEIPAINKNYNVWYVGLQLNWKLSSLYTTFKSMRQHDLKMEHIRSENEAVEKNIERRIHEAYTLYIQSLERLEIERKNEQLAKENYSVVEHRFNQQLALLTDMLDASNARIDAGVRLVNARISSLYYYYQLHFIAGTLIEL